jgi:hypothetical protein
LKTNGQWQSYAMDGILESPNDNNFGTIAIDKMEQNGFQPIATAWLVLMTNTFKKITAGSDTEIYRLQMLEPLQ